MNERKTVHQPSLLNHKEPVIINLNVFDMKKKLHTWGKAFILVLGMCLNFPTYSQIQSTTQGGTWYDPLTWVGGVIPGSGSNVIINGPVYVDAAAYCNDMLISPNGGLRNYSNNNQTLIASGSITNNGIIGNNNYIFTLYVAGNVSNNGTWQNYYTYLSGSSNQNLTLNQPFGGQYLSWYKPSGQLMAHSDLSFQNCNIDMGFGIIDFVQGDRISVNGGYILNVILERTTANEDTLELHMVSSHITNGTVNTDVLVMTGSVLVEGSTTINADVVNQGTLTNYNNNNHALWVNGEVVNNGSIGNNNYIFTLYFTGDLVNNGTWNNTYTYLTGAGDQSLYLHQPFSGAYFYYSKPSGNILAQTDLTFNSCNVDIGNGIVDFVQGDRISLTGGYLYNSQLIRSAKATDTLELNMTNAHLTNCTATTDMMVLTGTIPVEGSVTFNADVINQGTLTNYNNNNHALWVNGKVVNNGSIGNNYYNFTLYFTGDLVNNGTWNNTYTYLTGAGDQSLYLHQPFSGAYFFYSKPSGNILAQTDLAFDNCYVDIGNGIVDFVQGDKISLAGGYLYNSQLIRSAKATDTLELNMTSSHLTNCTATTDMMVLTGTIPVEGSVTFNADVINQGTLTNFNNNNHSVSINGKVVNNGSINNNSFVLSLSLTGDLVNNGTWSNTYTYLSGTGNQGLYLSQPFEGTYLYNNKSSGIIVAMTDLTFTNCNIHIDGGILDFVGGDKITVNGGYLSNPTMNRLTPSPDTLTLDMSNAYLYVATINTDVLKLSGTILSFGWSTFNANVINQGTLTNHNGGNYSAWIEGDLLNNGAIINNNYTFDIYITGDIESNGTWSNLGVYLAGDADQEIRITQPLSPQYFANYYTNGKVIAKTNLVFNNTSVDMAGDTLEFVGGNTLTVNGGAFHSGFLLLNTAKADTLVLSMSNNFLYNSTLKAANIRLEGTIQINYWATFMGNVLNKGTLMNYGNSNYDLTIDGSLHNDGQILNNNHILSMYITGDLVNHGIWSNYYTYLNGTGLQHLSFPNTCTGAYFIDTDPSSALEALAPVLFNGTTLDLSGATLTMPAYGSLMAMNGLLQNAIITGNQSSLEMNTGYLYNVNLYDMVLKGQVNVASYVVFHGNMTNDGTLQNHGGSNIDLTVYGNLTNNGLIQNNNYDFGLYIDGNVANNGNWQNSWTTLNGTVAQAITLVDNKPITGRFQLLTDNWSGGFLWYLNGTSLEGNPSFSGATDPTLVFLVPVTTAFAGTFYCQTYTGPSRNIFVNTMIAPKPFDLKVNLEGPFIGTAMNTQLNTGGVIPLNQPYGTAPWYYPGTEWVPAMPNADVVDWVLVEVRQASSPSQATPATIVGRCAGFLLKNGKITAIDGVNPVTSSFLVTNNLYAVVYHRNHLAVMSAGALPLSGSKYIWDFSTGAGQAYGGSNGHKQIATGVWGMVSGDGNANGQVNNNDKNEVWRPQSGSSGYKSGDFNLDKQVNNNDKIVYWQPNSGRATQVP